MIKLRVLIVLVLSLMTVKLMANSAVDADEIIDRAGDLYYADPDSSYKLCKTLDPESLSKEQQAELSMLLARYNLLTTDYESAEVELQNALNLYTELKNEIGVAWVYEYQSILADRMGEINRSKSLVLKAYYVYLELKDEANQAGALQNIAATYLLEQNADSAFYYLKRLDEIKESLKPSSYYFYFQNWGRYYKQVGEYEVAKDYYDKALKVAEENEMLDSKATLLMLVAELYLVQNKFEEATKYANLSYAFSDANDLIFEKKDALIVLVAIAEKEMDFLAAFKYQKELSDLDKEILNIEKINNVKKVKTLLDIAEKEKIIAAKDAELANSELETANARFTNRIFLFSLIAIIAILGLMAYAFVKTKKLNGIISDQHQSLELKNQQLSEMLNDIEGSINYSKLIQDTLLPGEVSWQKFFKEDFTIFLPRDKVSGDFYWNYEDNDFVYFCVADCTGHGVPGAMVSVVGMNALEAAVVVERLSSPAKILDRIAEIVENTFSNEEKSMKDGMDIAFCRMNKQTKELVYAGANNPLYVVNGKGLSIYKASKQPIGSYEGRIPFVEEEITLNEGDAIYLFSDGYADQFGGPKGKKFMYKALRLIIEENKSKTMQEQKSILLSSFNNWKEGYEQVDDVCVVGLRV